MNTGVSRSYSLYFEADGALGQQIPFNVIGSDAGLNLNPVKTSTLDISMAERWEVVFDFTGYANKNVTLRNMRQVAADDDYNSTDKVMREYNPILRSRAAAEAFKDSSSVAPAPAKLVTLLSPLDSATSPSHLESLASTAPSASSGTTAAGRSTASSGPTWLNA